MRSKNWIFFLVTLSLILSACAGGVPSTQAIPSIEELLPPEVVTAIKNQVSEALGVPIEDIQIVSVEQMEWPDGCLGLPQEGEECTQVITPGWLVVYSVNGQEFRLRVNETGTVIRQEP